MLLIIPSIPLSGQPVRLFSQQSTLNSKNLSSAPSNPFATTIVARIIRLCYFRDLAGDPRSESGILVIARPFLQELDRAFDIVELPNCEHRPFLCVPDAMTRAAWLVLVVVMFMVRDTEWLLV